MLLHQLIGTSLFFTLFFVVLAAMFGVWQLRRDMGHATFTCVLAALASVCAAIVFSTILFWIN